MKLRKLKLAGFKSFVDPTTVGFNSQLVGVVGPNGCGKSNIIDAVRWVMGESSAKNLRGGTMADVIFNGSSSRKPVGQASIELIFDNSEGKLGGEYASYSEIAIKRDVTRDGQSDYYLNGTKCRRRDITDIFLGTGLGPRSYSIIEQGMISRVIEAKPENLRAFLEEAAGISVYKKRRHDTELRLKHTKENLERIEDLIAEQERLLERLKRQSSAAMRYKEYDAEKSKLDLQLKSMRWRDFDKSLQQKAESIREVSNRLEEKLARKASIDNQLTTVKVEHNEKTDVVNEIQAKYYEIGTEITKREQTIQHQQERQEQLQLDLLTANDSLLKLNEEMIQDKEKLATFSRQLDEVEPEYQSVQTANLRLTETLEQEKVKLTAWNEDWDKLQTAIGTAQKKAEVEKTKIEQIEKQIREYQVNLDRLEQEQTSLEDQEFSSTIEQLSADIAIKEAEEQNNIIQIESLATEIKQQKQSQQTNNEAIDEFKDQIRVLKGKQASLQALQLAAMGKENKNLGNWLQQQNLADLPRLAEIIQVESGFEKAVETVLGDYLEAICVDDLPVALVKQNKALTDLDSGKLLFINNCTVLASDSSETSNTNSKDKVPLLSKITSKIEIKDLVANIFVVENLTVALNLLSTLNNSESIVTLDGIWIGKNWFRVYKDTDARAGILAREKELEDISLKIETLQASLTSSERKGDELKTIAVDLETKYGVLRQDQQTTANTLRSKSSELSSHKAKLDHINQRNKRITSEMKELNIKLEENAELINRGRLELEGFIDAMAKLAEEETKVQQEKELIDVSFSKVEKEALECKDKLHSISLTRQTLITQIEGVKSGIDRLTGNLKSSSSRQRDLETKLEQATPEEALQEELETLLAERLAVESNLNTARADLDIINEKIDDFEKERYEIERLAEAMHTELDKVKMEWQSLEVRKDTISEEFAKTEIKIEAILAELPENANETNWDERIAELTKKIERLGPINLAAIEEYKSESERAGYLQSQHTDLIEASETLENAIGQIDKETKATFKETFDRVNTSFKELFPKLFGGGEAYLELTGEDLLDTGVAVMAQPPGKKNSSIQLLSGGEKALTAVSLVFAIFQLNPAPFCMLDEVDAPLDDSNVGRFCKMIQEMSDKVQFIVITHNKITMEIAKQLAGVTMKEPGVSRLVTVDIEQAVKMVEA